MREKVARAPRWAVQLGSGVFFTVWMTVVGVVQGGALASSALSAGVGGILFGLFGGYVFHRINRQTLAATGDRVPTRAVRRATWRGPVPIDPDDRQQALALVEVQLHQWRWARPLGLGLAGLLGVGFVATTLIFPPPAWIALVASALALAFSEGAYRIARHRRAVLTGSADVEGRH